MSEADRAAECNSFNVHAQRVGWPMRCDATLSFDSARLREALEVWRGKAGSRRWPMRAEMTPRVMKKFLADLALIDVVYESGTVRYRSRVTGTTLARRFGEAPGRFFDELVPEKFLQRWQAMFALALRVGGPVRTMSRVEYREQDFLNVETLIAPLGEAGESPDAILVVAQFKARDAIRNPAV